MTLKPKMKAQLALRTEFGSMIGDTRIRLLEAIGKHGSIAQAAKQVPLSYKSAWDAVDEMNNLAEQSLVDRTIGGAQGGSTRLTAYGQQLIALYRAVESASQVATDLLTLEDSASWPGDAASFRRLLRRMSMRTSARNQFFCTVADIREGAVNAQVFLTLDGQKRLEAQITCESVAQLRLKPGQEVVALVKAGALLVLPDPQMRTSASNHLGGTISRIHAGPVNSELVVDLDLAQARHATAVITTDAVNSLALQVGAVVGLAFSASSVMLAVVG